jgi:hypothetical protein
VRSETLVAEAVKSSGTQTKGERPLLESATKERLLFTESPLSSRSIRRSVFTRNISIGWYYCAFNAELCGGRCEVRDGTSIVPGRGPSSGLVAAPDSPHVTNTVERSVPQIPSSIDPGPGQQDILFRQFLRDLWEYFFHIAAFQQLSSTTATAGARFLAGSRDFSLLHSLPTGPEARRVSYPVGTEGSFPGGNETGAVKLTIHFHLVPRSRIVEPYLRSPIRLMAWRLVY